MPAIVRLTLIVVEVLMQQMLVHSLLTLEEVHFLTRVPMLYHATVTLTAMSMLMLVMSRYSCKTLAGVNFSTPALRVLLDRGANTRSGWFFSWEYFFKAEPFLRLCLVLCSRAVPGVAVMPLTCLLQQWPDAG